MKNITLHLILDSLTYSRLKLDRLVGINFCKKLNYLKVRMMIFRMRTLAPIVQKITPPLPLKESSHD